MKALDINCDTGLSFTTITPNINSQYGTNGLFFQSGGSSSNFQPSQLALTNLTGSGNSSVISAGNATIQSSVSTGAGNPILTLNNSTAGASAGVAIETNKNGGAGVNGDEIFRLSMKGKNSTNTTAEYGRITTFIRDSTTPSTGVDGAMIFSVPVNNTMTSFIDLNGNSNRVNCLRQLNIQNNDIISSGGDIHLNATASTGTGQVILAPKVGSYLIMNNLPTSSAGLPSGAVWRNGVVLNIVP